MPAKIRLARHGRKRYAYYHIVVADSRAPRDGRYIERIGSYNPNTNPATIDLDFDKAIDWLFKGAQPTDTVRNILSYKGVMFKKHLLGGVKKGAFDEAEAEKRFEAWLTEKEAKIQAKIDRLASEKDQADKKQLDSETKIKEDRTAAIEAKNAELAAEVAAEKAEKEAEAAAKVAAETPVETEAPAEVETPAETEAPVAKEETPAKTEVIPEAPVAEVETPAETEVTPEAPAAKETPAEEKKADSAE